MKHIRMIFDFAALLIVLHLLSACGDTESNAVNHKDKLIDYSISAKEKLFLAKSSSDIGILDLTTYELNNKRGQVAL